MSKEKKTPKFKQLPQGFVSWKGRCSWDMPQEFFSLKDHKKVKVVLRSGEVLKKKVCKLDWTNTFKKTDIVGYEPLKRNRK